MNNAIAALEKKRDIKQKRLQSRIKAVEKSKETIKQLKNELLQIENEIAKEEMLEMTELMSKNHLSIDDVKAAISSGSITAKEKIGNDSETVAETIAEINKEEQ